MWLLWFFVSRWKWLDALSDLKRSIKSKGTGVEEFTTCLAAMFLAPQDELLFEHCLKQTHLKHHIQGRQSANGFDHNNHNNPSWTAAARLKKARDNQVSRSSYHAYLPLASCSVVRFVDAFDSSSFSYVSNLNSTRTPQKPKPKTNSPQKAISSPNKSALWLPSGSCTGQ